MNFKSSKGFAGAGLALVIALSSIGGAAAQQLQPRAIDTVMQVAVTPLSMRYFCAQNREECRGGGAGQVRLTDNVLSVLQQVNAQVNRAIRPRRDTNDVWSLDPAYGDCEDYVLSKRSALVRNGIPAGSLRIAYTRTRAGAPHAVLVVRTSEGDLVLDNLNNNVKTLRQSGYNIRSMSSSDPTRWTAG